VPEKLIPFRLSDGVDSAAAELLRKIRLAYFEKSRELALCVGTDLSSAALVLSLYFQAWMRDLTLRYQASAGTPATVHRSENCVRAYIVSLELLARHLPATPEGTELAVSEAFLHAVPPLLQLAFEVHALREFAVRIGENRVRVSANGNTLSFEDLHGLSAGSMIQTEDELADMVQGLPAQKPLLPPAAVLPDHFGKLSPKTRPPLDHIRLWYRRDFIAECYAGLNDYVDALRRLMNIFQNLALKTLPPISESTRIGNTTWLELRSFWYFHYALCQEHFTIALGEFALRRKPRAEYPSASYLFLPGALGEPDFTVHAATLTDLVCFTSSSTLIDLATKVISIDQVEASGLLDRMIYRLVPGAIPSADNMFSALIELAPLRLLLVPSLGMLSTADSETMQRFIEVIDSKAFHGVVGRAKASVAAETAKSFSQFGNLRTVVDEKLKGPNGKDLVDIDLGVYDETHELLVCFEFKSTRLQDVRNINSFEATVRDACDQLTTVANHLNENDGAHFKRIFNSGTKPRRIVPVIVTRRTYGLGEHAGVPIITLVALGKLLQQAGGDMFRFVELVEKRDLAQAAEARHPTETATISIGEYQWSVPGRRV
jgi:hypothetical protein